MINLFAMFVMALIALVAQATLGLSTFETIMVFLLGSILTVLLIETNKS